MGNGDKSPFNLQALLARTAPPRVPDAAFDEANCDLTVVTSWKRPYAVTLLAGLSTDPAYHANGIRFDWLQRLVLSKAAGRRKPNRAELTRALNTGLGRAGVLRLEDPIEDLFCERVVTDKGSFRIFSGQWESAAAYTQTVLDAFTSLPPASLKRDALKAVYALLRLSEALAERAAVDPQTTAGGNPMSEIALPQSAVLERLARRVRFSDAELEKLSIDKAELTPFLLDIEQYNYVTDREPGETPLEFHPLLPFSREVVVASPANLSIAMRSVLINAALIGGVDEFFLAKLLEKQEQFSEMSRFWPIPHLKLSPRNRQNMRVAVVQFAQGRFLQVIQVPSTFNGFPEHGFASVRALGADADASIRLEVTRFWSLLNGQHDLRQAVTVLLMSGWGAPHIVSPLIDESSAPRNWQILNLSFADAATLGVCKNGKFQDVCRLIEQVDRLEGRGFVIHNVNGFLNLFAHWRATDGNLVPEHMSEMAPPCNIMIPTDGLLEPRVEAARSRDPQALLLPSGGSKRVQRMDWQEGEKTQSIYASPEDAMAGRLLGAVVTAGRTWWLECEPETMQAREWSYRIWEAAIQWLAKAGDSVISQYSQAFPEGTFMVRLVVPESPKFTSLDRAAFTDQDLEASVTCSPATDGQPATVTIAVAWAEHLWNPENDAETELTAALLGQLTVAPSQVSRADLRAAVQAAIGSTDWRWIHAQPVVTPLDHMRMHGLAGPFHEPSFSAAALARCCSIWDFRNPTDGSDIDGERECEEFLARYCNHILETLMRSIHRFNRCMLVRAAADAFQAARIEQENWRGSIKAMRAIHGNAAHAKAFKTQNAVNAVQRAAKSICEIAACEGTLDGGLDPDPIDLEELFALAILLLGNGQLFASIKGGIVKPSLRISPAGDLLSDRSILSTILRPGAEWLTTRMLNEAAIRYSHVRMGPEPSEQHSWTPELLGAVEAEYGVSAEAFVSLQYEVVRLAEALGQGVLTMRRSRLSAALPEDAGDWLPLLQRLTLARVPTRSDRSGGLLKCALDLGRMDRPFSVINRPLLALDDAEDPLLLVSPLFVSDASMYSLSGLIAGTLQGKYWNSKPAIAYAGRQADLAGKQFEELVAKKLTALGLWVRARCTLGWLLNQKVDPALGDIDVLAVSADRRRVWAIETKNLRLCRTETEVAARISEYRGRMVCDNKNRAKPDKLLRHLRRIEYLRERRAALRQRLGLELLPEVNGLLVVDAPQPMNFFMLEEVRDARSVHLDTICDFNF